MPRDLSALADESTLSAMSHLSTSPEREPDSESPTPSHPGHPLGNSKRDQINPYTQTLSLSDVESCVRLEEAAFPPHERATREKFQYRLKRCGELSMGIFTSLEHSTVVTAATSSPVYSGTPERKAVLLGHIVCTKTTNTLVTEDDMAIPTAENPDTNLGHKEDGRTVCIHSLAILPDYQGRALGKTLMKAYLQRLESSGVADRAALIAHKHLIPMYEKLGFQNKGESDAQFGGGGWYDMVKEFQSVDELSD